VYASNCANLALNLGFDGVFVEADAAKAEHARSFYARHPDTRERPPAVINAFITRENVNDLVRATTTGCGMRSIPSPPASSSSRATPSSGSRIT
jgi:hypothetical protein